MTDINYQEDQIIFIGETLSGIKCYYNEHNYIFLRAANKHVYHCLMTLETETFICDFEPRIIVSDPLSEDEIIYKIKNAYNVF